MKIMNSSTFESFFRAISLPTLVLKQQEEQFLLLDANEAYLQITGSTLDDLVGKLTSEAFPKNPSLDFYGADVLLRSFRKVIRHKQKDGMDVLRYDIPVRGTTEFLEKYWSFENVPVLNESGEVEYVLHMIRDVTDQVISEKKTQSEFEHKLQQFQHFVEANPEGMYSLDLEGNFLNTNQALADLVELPMDRMLEMDFLPFCSAEDRDYIVEHFQKVLAGTANRFEAKFISAKGKDLYLDISLAPMKRGNEIIGAYGIARNLTVLRQTEKIIVTKKSYLEANAAFLEALMQKDLDPGSLQESLSQIGQAIDVDRIYYYSLAGDPATGEPQMNLQTEWRSNNAPGRDRESSFEALSLKKVCLLLGKSNLSKPFSAITSELPEGELKQLLELQQIKSSLILPIFLEDKLLGLIGYNDCRRERQWSEDELMFLRSLANILTTAYGKRAASSALLQREQELKHNEQKFKALVQESADLIAILDLEGNYTFVSESSRRNLDTAPEEFYGLNAFEFIHPEDQAAVMEEYRALEQVKQIKLAPYRFRNKKGEWRWLETTLTNLTDDPAVQGIVANSRDITTLLAQQKEIRQINERYQLAASATKDLMYDWDLSADQVVRFHKDLPDFLGHSIATVDQRNFWLNHIHPEELKELKQRQKEVLEDKEKNHITAEYRFRRADGSYAYLIDRAYIIRDDQGIPVRMVGATSDVSDLKDSLQALKVANRRFKLVMKATKEVIWDYDIPSKRIVRGKTFTKISGHELKKEDQTLDFWFSKIHPDDRDKVELSLRAAMKDPSRKKWRQEYRLIKADGQVAYLIDRGFIVRDPSGAAIRVVGSALDATESRIAMKKIKDQNKILRDIAWEQSHLVRAPLARLKGLLDMLQRGDTSLLTVDEIMQLMNVSYEELDAIIRNIVHKSAQIDPPKNATIRRF